MGTAFLISFICIFNIVLWCVFLSKFKKLFSTNDIRNELNRMIADINKNTAQDLTLIENKISDLKSILDIADKKISTLRAEETKRIAVESFKEDLASAAPKKAEDFPRVPQGLQSAYTANIPIYKPKVTFSEKPIEKKKDSVTLIKELFSAGETVEEIARKTGKTTTEVTMVIDMNL